MEFNKTRVYHITEYQSNGHNGQGNGNTVLSSDFGDWLDLPQKSTQIFDEQLPLQYKLDLMSYPDKAILYLVGQFGLKSDFLGASITLGVLPLNTRPKQQLKLNFTTQSTEVYLIIETTGEVKLNAVSGDLPTTLPEEIEELNPYHLNLDYPPKIEDDPGTGNNYTAVRSQSFTRNNCGAGNVGTAVTYTKTYNSTISQADADIIRSNDAVNFLNEGQIFANNPNNGSVCEVQTVFYKTRTESFTRTNCGAGTTGTALNFSKTYSSNVSQADADAKAFGDTDFASLGEAYANDPLNGATCENAVIIPPVEYTATRTAKFTRNNCGAGNVGTAVTYTKTYKSIISQADADAQLETNFNIDGQNFANDPLNGAVCISNGDYSIYLYIDDDLPNKIVTAKLMDNLGFSINAIEDISFDWSLKISGALHTGTAKIFADTNYWPVWTYDSTSDNASDFATSNALPATTAGHNIITG